MTKTKSKKLSHRRVLTEVIGWYGAIAILLAYTLASFSVVSVHSSLYLILNLTGALGVLSIARAKHVRQSMVVNAFWAIMAGLALLKIII